MGLDGMDGPRIPRAETAPTDVRFTSKTAIEIVGEPQHLRKPIRINGWEGILDQVSIQGDEVLVSITLPGGVLEEFRVDRTNPIEVSE